MRNKLTIYGVLKGMRIRMLMCAFLTLITIAGHDAAASDQLFESFSQAAEAVLHQGGYPVLFVGRIAEADPGHLPCTNPSQQSVTYSVKSVLFGFVPPDRLKVTYPKCGRLGTQFSSQGDVLVLAMSSGQDFWASQKELALPTTSANLQKAQSILNADLKKRITRFMRYHGPPHNNRVVVFEGTVREPVPHFDQPIVCKEQPLFPINYDIEQVLNGSWTEKQIVLLLGACFSLPDPPIRIGQRMIVFAFVTERRSQTVYGSLDLSVAPGQMSLVKDTLGLP